MKISSINSHIIWVFSCTTKKADMIIYNGNIYTVNDLNPCSAVAVKDGKILI